MTTDELVETFAEGWHAIRQAGIRGADGIEVLRTAAGGAKSMTLYPCEACGAEYTSILAADACEDDDRQNRYDR